MKVDVFTQNSGLIVLGTVAQVNDARKLASLAYFYPNTKKFRRTLIYYNMDTQFAYCVL